MCYNRAVTARILRAPAVTFPATWLLAVALVQIPLYNRSLLRLQPGWSTTMWVVAIVTPLAFALGAVTAQQTFVRSARFVAFADAVTAPSRLPALGYVPLALGLLEV